MKMCKAGLAVAAAALIREGGAAQLLLRGLNISSGKGKYEDGHRAGGKFRQYHENGNMLYEGGLKNGKRHGQGREFFESGQLAYEGVYKDGHTAGGKFCQYYKNGNMSYEGGLKNGKRHGQGREYFESGKLGYEGEYKDGHTAGGKFYCYHENGNLGWEGRLQDGKPHGQVREYFKSGKLAYEGEYKGRRHGQGREYFESGQLAYEGNFKDGKRHGQGREYFETGNLLYEGGLKNGKRHGQGREFFESGQLAYEGEYKDGNHRGVRFGEGKMYSESGELIYEGKLENEKPHGKGKYYYASDRLNQYIEKRNFYCDLAQAVGDGKLYYETGKLHYEGEFEDGDRNGKGKLYLDSGKILYKGDFKDGKPAGQGEYYRVNGLLAYAGEVKDGVPHGKGKQYRETGTVRYKGEFKDGRRNGKGNIFLDNGKLFYEGEIKTIHDDGGNDGHTVPALAAGRTLPPDELMFEAAATSPDLLARLVHLNQMLCPGPPTRELSAERRQPIPLPSPPGTTLWDRVACRAAHKRLRSVVRLLRRKWGVQGGVQGGVQVASALRARCVAKAAIRRLQGVAGKLKAQEAVQVARALKAQDAVAADMKLRHLQGMASKLQTQQGLKVARGLKAWAHEKRFFRSLPAVDATWYKTVVYTTYTPESKIAQSIDRIKRELVPGLGSTTFGNVFRAFAAKGCPIWLVGGVVRDLLAGDEPKDVDAAALCGPSDVAEIIKKEGWQPRVFPSDESHHWSVGDTSDPRHLEGFSLGTFLRAGALYKGDSSVSMLHWSVEHDMLVDLTGAGQGDAKCRRVRPAVPVGLQAQAGWTDWQHWQAWYEGGTRKLARHLRMRMRGWQPFSEPFRAFMAHHLANQRPSVDSTTGRRRPPEVAHFVHESLAQQAPHASLEHRVAEKQAWLLKFFDVVKEDLVGSADAPLAAAERVLRDALSDTCMQGPMQGTMLLDDLYAPLGRAPRGGPVLLHPHMFHRVYQMGVSLGLVSLEDLRTDMVRENCVAITGFRLLPLPIAPSTPPRMAGNRSSR